MDTSVFFGSYVENVHRIKRHKGALMVCMFCWCHQICYTRMHSYLSYEALPISNAKAPHIQYSSSYANEFRVMETVSMLNSCDYLNKLRQIFRRSCESLNSVCFCLIIMSWIKNTKNKMQHLFGLEQDVIQGVLATKNNH